MLTGTTTPPRRKSPSLRGSGDEQINARNPGNGKGKEKEVYTSRTSPLRNVTPPGALAEFPIPSLPISRPSTPLRSAMASTSRFKAPSPSQHIPLANSTSVSSLGKGKRKADEVDGGGEDLTVGGPTLPLETTQQQRRSVHRATFAAEPRSTLRMGLTCFESLTRTLTEYRTSTSSHTTSHYARRKRARLSSGTSLATNQTVSEHGVRAPSRSESSRRRAPYAASSASRGSHTPTQSLRAGSASSHQQHSVRYVGQPQRARHPSSTRGSSKRGSVSQVSIPISALISPHAPSISLHPSTTYHMRDPRKPSPVHPTSWSLSFPSAGPHERGWLAGCFNALTWGRFFERAFRRQIKGKEQDIEGQTHQQEEDGGKFPVVDWTEGGGSPIHAWLFFLGFILFPVWWIAGLFIGIPKTRTLEGRGLEEKSVVLDDPQVEHDAKSWRTRCRVMAAISLFTYIPFIVLVVVFVPRSER
ncbi:uncharacterized protein C8R40DRAFT_1117486 [Lentinula edodes]|uniref:uncharacterized protein n=1 Tax=Lentinula edodes TaxID=5353 RepID=UPI001E8D3F4B|nr:uncharacterized protein C8R40DRAFT_1117486 [Lentinula edodes]KAH7872272.1 hypothetical protein C8R40DRAFT_1117486 [Lentinula edodes]